MTYTPSTPVQAGVTPCKCAMWGRDNSGTQLYLTHHPNCDQYHPEEEIRELLQQLIKGIEAWAADEDGVHPDCWEAYRRACDVCGQWGRSRQMLVDLSTDGMGE